MGAFKKGKVAATLLASLVLTASIAAYDGGPSNWSYSGSNGPANWHDLSPANGLCLYGKQQSPIDIEGTDPAIMHRLETDYQVTPVHLSNNRVSIMQDYDKGSYLLVGAKRFELQQFHFHTPAEHTVMGEQYPMAIHFVHKAVDGSLAVIAVFVKEGKANIAAQELYENIPLESDQIIHKDKVLINARDLMPNDKSYYRYMGSLTTPPCTEDVNWYVLKTPVEFSGEQINLMRGLLGGNTARPTQNRNNRIILDARPQ
ncbi:carbonic anhydrase [Kordiimonas pumila]|uniref:carbonic anhydrase n=1 Tax=Kordiimonas pumila TaxID=2161677 RepID=A0ABV7D0K9_9PROT|nr:carbonic anhydrase family protein [Kordiimonas pumila]